MGTTTFSGPVKAGTIKNTTGTLVGDDIANTGFVEMSQISPLLTQAALFTDPATTIVIPEYSTIKGIHVFATVAFTGADDKADFGFDDGTVVTDEALNDGTDIAAIGKTNVSPTASAATVKNWVNVGAGDKRIRVKPVNTGDGACYVVVEYVQATKIATA